MRAKKLSSLCNKLCRKSKTDTTVMFLKANANYFILKRYLWFSLSTAAMWYYEILLTTS